MTLDDLNKAIEILTTPLYTVAPDLTPAEVRQFGQLAPAPKLSTEQLQAKEKELLIKLYTNQAANQAHNTFIVEVENLKKEASLSPHDRLDDYPAVLEKIRQQRAIHENKLIHYEQELRLKSLDDLKNDQNFDICKNKLKDLMEAPVLSNSQVTSKDFYKQTQTNYKLAIEESKHQYHKNITALIKSTNTEFKAVLRKKNFFAGQHIIVQFERILKFNKVLSVTDVNDNVISDETELVLTCARIAFLKYQLELSTNFDTVYEAYKMNDIAFYASAIVFFSDLILDDSYIVDDFQNCLNLAFQDYNTYYLNAPYNDPVPNLSKGKDSFLIDLGILDTAQPPPYEYADADKSDKFDRSEYTPEQNIPLLVQPESVGRDILGLRKLTLQFTNNTHLQNKLVNSPANINNTTESNNHKRTIDGNVKSTPEDSPPKGNNPRKKKK